MDSITYNYYNVLNVYTRKYFSFNFHWNNLAIEIDQQTNYQRFRSLIYRFQVKFQFNGFRNVNWRLFASILAVTICNMNQARKNDVKV